MKHRKNGRMARVLAGGLLPACFYALLLLLMWAMPACAHAQGRPKFGMTRYDFGEIKEENGPVHTNFRFANTGDKPLKLLSVKATCGCTTPIWSRDSILPGDSGLVRVEFNPMGRPGVFAKEIMVETNGSPSQVSLSILGKVTPRPKGPEDFYPFEEGNIRMRTNHLTYGRIYHNDSATLSTTLYNQGTKPIQFSKSGSKVPSHLRPKMSKTTLAPGDTLTLWVTYLAPKKKDWGFAFDNIYLSTNDANRPMKTVNISADILERFSAETKASPPNLTMPKLEIDLGTVTEGEMPTAVFEVKNTGKSDLTVRKLSAACSCITTKGFGTLKPGESGTITLTFNSRGRVGEFEKDAILIANDPDRAVTTLQIRGVVVRPAHDK